MGAVRAMDRCGGYRIYNLGELQPVALADLIPALEATLRKHAAPRPAWGYGCAGLNPWRGGEG
jgi:hypothetical protein